LQACEYTVSVSLEFKLTNGTEHSNSWVVPVAVLAQVGALGLGEVVLLEVLERCPQTLSSFGPAF
jgi:hypothetical protein